MPNRRARAKRSFSKGTWLRPIDGTVSMMSKEGKAAMNRRQFDKTECREVSRQDQWVREPARKSSEDGNTALTR